MWACELLGSGLRELGSEQCRDTLAKKRLVAASKLFAGLRVADLWPASYSEVLRATRKCCELLGSLRAARKCCELLGMRATRKCCELLGSAASYSEACELLGSAASCHKSLRVLVCESQACGVAGLGAPLRPLKGSLQALLSPRDCLSSGPHVAESTGLRSAEF